MHRTWRNRLYLLGGILIVAIFDLPILITIITSFKSDAAIQASPPVWLFTPVLTHYHHLFSAAGYNFYRFVVNSIIIATATSVLVVLLAMPASYAMSRLQGRLPVLYGYVASLRLIPYVALTVPFYLLFQQLGLLDTLLALVLVDTLFNLPLAVMMFVNAMRESPLAIEESARIDGAGLAALLWRIVLPMSLPTITAVMMLSFIGAWNEFLFALMLTVRVAMPVTVGASLFVTAFGIQWGNMAAAISISVIPTLLLAFLAQRYLIGGLTAGAVKG